MKLTKFISFFFISSFLLKLGCSDLLVSTARAEIPQVYTVGNFTVQAIDKNAVEAKKKAMTDGGIEAFQLLVKRLTSYSSYGRIPKLNTAIVNRMLNGLSVRQERNSRTEYVAVFDFKFAPDRVRRFLQKAAIPFTDIQAKKTTILPVFMGKGKNSTSWKREWRNAWKGLDLIHSLTPVRLGDITPDLTQETMTSILAGDLDAYDRLANGYGTDQLLLAIVSEIPDQGQMNVRMIGRDAVGAFGLDRNYQIFDGQIIPTLESAATISLGVVEGRWKAIRIKSGPEALIPKDASEKVNLTVQFSGLREWQNIRAELRKVSGVEDLDVGSISARGAQLSLSFPGGAARLSQVLLNHNFSLNNVAGNWILRKF